MNVLNLKRLLFKKAKAPIANIVIHPKMTPEAKEYLWLFKKNLIDSIDHADDIIESTPESLTLKEYLDFIAPKIDVISKTQKEDWLYLPIHTMLYMIVKKQKPALALETGVEKGGSTFMILKAMKENQHGTLFSIDIEKYYKHNKKYVSEIAPLVSSELKERWEFICGDAQDETKKFFDAMNKIDLFLAGQTHTYEIQKQEVELAWKYIKSGGILILDRPDNNKFRFQNEFVRDNVNEIAWQRIFSEGRDEDGLKFTVFVKK